MESSDISAKLFGRVVLLLNSHRANLSYSMLNISIFLVRGHIQHTCIPNTMSNVQNNEFKDNVECYTLWIRNGGYELENEYKRHYHT